MDLNINLVLDPKKNTGYALPKEKNKDVPTKAAIPHPCGITRPSPATGFGRSYANASWRPGARSFPMRVSLRGYGQGLYTGLPERERW